MNTILDILQFNREYPSRHLRKPDRGWWITGLALALIFVLSLILARAGSAQTTEAPARGLTFGVNQQIQAPGAPARPTRTWLLVSQFQVRKAD